MNLKFKYEKKEQVPAEVSGLYVERDGAFFLNAEGAVDKAQFENFQTEKQSLLTQLDEMKKPVKSN